MHDFDNSFLSPCPRDIRAKDRTGSTEAFRGSLYIREKSMILIVIVATPVRLRVEEGCNLRNHGISIARRWFQHATNTVGEMIGKLFILEQRNLWIFPHREIGQFSPSISKRFFKHLKFWISTNFNLLPSNWREKLVWNFSKFVESSKFGGKKRFFAEELFDDPRSVDKITKRVEYDRSLVHQETISLAGNKRGIRRFFGRKMNFCCCLRRLDTETRRQLRATIRNILNHRPVN